MTQRVGLSLCEAFVAYDDGDYAKAVDLLTPLKYDILSIGGSNAQVRTGFCRPTIVVETFFTFPSGWQSVTFFG